MKRRKLAIFAVIIIGASVLFIVYYQTQNAMHPSYLYQSQVNLSTACAVMNAPNSDVSNSSLSSFISSIERYPKFVALSGNRTGYTYDGASCLESSGSIAGPGTNLSFAFQYDDRAHPFPWSVCGEVVSRLPQYYIIVNVDLTPSGYDLNNSTFIGQYYGPTNMTVFSCTTT
ncbi:MAG TPA: hypothetical protein VJN71_06525 [Nitrososphaerales archaeon]|nr:hypothetical protein [Nitrososphaerales archaeon]